MNRLKLQIVTLALVSCTVLNRAQAGDNIVSVADKAGTFKTLLAAAKAAGLARPLQQDGPFTVFAPTDDAFAKLPEHTVRDLLRVENSRKLARILKYHLVPGRITAKDAIVADSAATLAKDSVTFSIESGQLSVNHARVIANDVEASNGIIHVIDSVLMPPQQKNILETAAAAGTFKTLLAATDAAGLTETLEADGPYTLLAPSDKAFAKLPHGTLESLLKPENKSRLQRLLKQHIVFGYYPQESLVDIRRDGAGFGYRTLARTFVGFNSKDGKVVVNDHAKIVVTDVDASNGVIHVIDEVLTPPPGSYVPFETGTDVELLSPLNPKLEAKLSSTGTGDPVSLSFCNLSSKPITVFWIQFNGERRKWRSFIEPGELDICEQTYENHVWLIGDEHGKALNLYVVGQQDAVIVNTK